ncbi:hypothetical protein C8Q77DRAFT_821113 [Trametes polyzona]|nr:hypothetical protein C8Q77DRAFT_821113 [Trametes polyzona]
MHEQLRVAAPQPHDRVRTPNAVSTNKRKTARRHTAGEAGRRGEVCWERGARRQEAGHTTTRCAPSCMTALHAVLQCVPSCSLSALLCVPSFHHHHIYATPQDRRPQVLQSGPCTACGDFSRHILHRALCSCRLLHACMDARQSSSSPGA